MFERKLLFWGGLVSFVIIVFIVTFFTEGVCIADAPTELDTRFTRRFKTSYCEGELPCHIYLTYSEDPAHSIFVNFQISSFVDNPMVYYDDISHNNSSLQTYRHFQAAKAHRFKTMDLDRGIYWAYLTNLTQNQVYYFRVGNGDDDNLFSSEKSFRTTPASGSFNFVLGGDVSVTDMANQVSVQAAATNPHFAVVGGDIDYSNGFVTCYRRMDQFLFNWQTLMVTSTGLMIPMILAIGNHEAGGFNAYGMNTAPFYDTWFPQAAADDDNTTILNRTSYHKHNISDSTVLLSLDSEVQSKAGGDQLDWIISSLDSTYTNKFAVYHAPMYPGYRPYNSTPSDSLRDHWISPFDQYNLTVAFENHDHLYKRSRPLKGGQPDDDGTLYVGDGCWGVKPRDEDSIPADKDWYLKKLAGKNYVLSIQVDGSLVNISALDSKGETFDNVLRQDPIGWN